MHTHMHTQAPLAAKESEAADKHRCLTSHRDAEAPVFMRVYARARAPMHMHTHMHMHMCMYMHMCTCMY